MAAIDFPAAPATNQLFTAANGVTYMWNGMIWIVQAGPGGGTGDFYALHNTTMILGAAAILPVNTVLSGNGGGWYSTSTFRYTPPAGRYRIRCSGTFYSTGAAAAQQLQLRRNGNATPIAFTNIVVGGGWEELAAIEVTVDANGADYYEVWGTSGNVATLSSVTFSAFPLTGMQGPTGGAPGSVVGDFSATHNVNFSLPAIGSGIAPNTVLTGNSGGYYNPVNGRYTPPAGRYYIEAVLYGSNTGTPTTINIQIRKNTSTIVYTAGSLAALAGYNGEVTCGGLVDANGSDYFDLFGSSNNSTTSTSVWFTAFPTQGMVGPQGPPGVISNGFRLLQRTDVSSAVVDVNIQNIPADINDLRFTFDLTHVTNATQSILQFYNNTGALVTAGQYGSAVTLTTSTMAAGATPFAISGGGASITNGILLTYSGAGNNVSNTLPIRGSGTICNIRAAGRPKTVDFQCVYLNDTATVWNIITGGGVWGISPTAVTGFRIVAGGGNIASGAFSVWGSP